MSEAMLIPIELERLPKEPLVTVLIPNYNYEHYVSFAIESVLRQTYKNIEICICDDGSIDGSRDVIQKYADKYQNIKYVKKENGGQATALNEAYKLADGEIFCLLDSDDLFMDSKIEKVVNQFKTSSQAGICTHFLLPVSANDSPLGNTLPAKLDSGWLGFEALKGKRIFMPGMSGLSFRKAVLRDIFPIPVAFRKVADGYMRNLAKYVSSIVCINEALTRYRIHGGNVTASKRISISTFKNLADDYALINAHERKFLVTKLNVPPKSMETLWNSQEYLEYNLAASIMESNKRLSRELYGKLAMNHLVTDSRRRRIWKALVILPRLLAKMLLQWWWGNSRLKRIIKSLV
ncbi:glycosyltransferase family 2 protein [Candidatus Neomarinimicrobiota bacterium]